MNIWLKSALIGLVAAALFFVANQAGLFQQKQNKFFAKPQLFNLDYKVRASPPDSAKNKDADLLPVIRSIEKRMLNAGFKCETTVISDAMLTIDIQQCDDTALATQLITQNGKLEFKPLYSLVELKGAITKLAEMAAAGTSPPPKPIVIDTDTIETQFPLKKLKPEDVVPEPDPPILKFALPYDDVLGMQHFAHIATVLKTDTALLNKILSNPDLTDLLPAAARFCYGPVADPKSKAELLLLYVVRDGGIQLGHEDIDKAEPNYTQDGQSAVSFNFDPVGSRKWTALTAENIGKPIAIIINNSVISAPLVNQAIEGGKAIISGGFTAHDARVLAAQLSAGSLPANIVIVERDARKINNVSNAGIAALVISVFMVTSVVAALIFNMLKNK